MNILRAVRTRVPVLRAAQGSVRQAHTESKIHKSKRLWVIVPAVAFLGVYTYVSKGTEDEPVVFDDWVVGALGAFPTRALSRLWGAVNEIDLPVALRKPLLGAYASIFGCNLEEAADGDLEHYSNLQKFFGRDLRDGVRPLSPVELVSPADCRVLHFGTLSTNGRVDQVKGISYSLEALLGLSPSPRPGNKLFHIVLYLAPGDYHNFHSPADWQSAVLRHFPGPLFSVSPAAARKIAGLFSVNERVVLQGSWKHGTFSFVAVGAYNVGSIHIDSAPSLRTNEATPRKVEQDLSFQYAKGQKIGGFRLGSTVVLVFEAPESFHFDVTPGQRLRYGEQLGSLGSTHP
eukprot:m.235227 g.235227  ORF g.235227 m.235227 type:complete len:345 (-) comp19953_c0_seq1:173-1207(-)